MNFADHKYLPPCVLWTFLPRRQVNFPSKGKKEIGVDFTSKNQLLIYQTKFHIIPVNN